VDDLGIAKRLAIDDAGSGAPALAKTCKISRVLMAAGTLVMVAASLRSPQCLGLSDPFLQSRISDTNSNSQVGKGAGQEFH
jgi:hypothetical protein